MTLKWINTLAFAAMVTVNALANLLPLGGNTTGQISEAYPNLFTPAPYTFAIWGLIYLMMAVFVLYQWELFDNGLFSADVREDIGLWFAVSCVLNIGWLFLWHYKKIGLSTLCIALLLVSLIVIGRRLNGAGGNLLQRLAAKGGFSLYLGWIIAATIANLAVFLTKIGWNGFGLSADLWTVAALLLGSVIAIAVVVFGGNTIAGFSILWAFGGILYRHISPAYLDCSHPFVIAAAVLGEILLLTALCLPLLALFLPKSCSVAEKIKRPL